MSEIEYLVGNKKFENLSIKPFDDAVCNFLSSLSKNINNSNLLKDYSDIKTFAFMCRKSNIEKLKSKINQNEFRRGLGLLFHITPSNIPTNFAYSLLFGVLSGNTNVIKVPSKKFPQIDLICKFINVTLKKYKKVRKMINIVRYQNNDEFTKSISSKCDGRLIWGGDKTINEIRKFPMKEISRDIAFANRNSICLMNSSEILKLNKKDLNRLVQKFYNDTFLVDQNACSSPHVIFWYGNKTNKAKIKFWTELHYFAKNNYNLEYASSFYKYDRLLSDILTNTNYINHTSYGGYIYCINLKNKHINLTDLVSRWGYFYQFDIKNINMVLNFSNNNTQTLTYFGFKKEMILKNFDLKYFKGIDRIVPVGQALDINLNWDGYDVINALTRIIDLR
tara:strand:+ start:384 stop:1559 length:1176 start_codon:yes stop_codon:yes gene_type:complete